MKELLFYYDHFTSRPRGGWNSVNITKDKNIFYVHTSLLEKFLNEYITSEKNICLVTEGGDLCIHENSESIIVANSHMLDIICIIPKRKICKNIKYWISTNNNTSSLSIQTVPFGFWRKIDYLPNIKKTEDKINKILMCFNPQNYPILRNNILNKYKNDKNVEFLDFPIRQEPNQNNPYYSTQTHSMLLSAVNNFKYLMCPESLGLDTNRLWECKLLNTIAITSIRPFYTNIKNMLDIHSVDMLNFDTNDIINQNNIRFTPEYYLREQYWKWRLQYIESNL